MAHRISELGPLDQLKSGSSTWRMKRYINSISFQYPNVLCLQCHWVFNLWLISIFSGNPKHAVLSPALGVSILLNSMTFNYISYTG